MRRHFVDNFFFTNRDLIRGQIIDIGGKKSNKRGLFNVDKYSPTVTYVNIEKDTNPDILAPAENIPISKEQFDVAIMGELLEHVPDPIKVVSEAYRILKKDGMLIITVPFMIGIHGDPFDYGRYTETFWKEVAEKCGFEIVKIERQGSIFAVMALMFQHLFLAKGISWRPIQIPLIKFLMWIDRKTINTKLTAWTTGYGIVLKK